MNGAAKKGSAHVSARQFSTPMRGLNYMRIEGGYLLQLKLLIVHLKGNSLTRGSGFENWPAFVSAR